MYIKITNEIALPYSINELKSEYKDISFPETISDSLLAEYNVFPYLIETENYNPITQTLRNSGFVKSENNEWKNVFVAENLPLDIASNRVRDIRNNLLSQTDYLALSDNNLSSEMLEYRKLLRNITLHPDFPYLSDNDWPTKPENI